MSDISGQEVRRVCGDGGEKDRAILLGKCYSREERIISLLMFGHDLKGPQQHFKVRAPPWSVQVPTCLFNRVSGSHELHIRQFPKPAKACSIAVCRREKHIRIEEDDIHANKCLCGPVMDDHLRLKPHCTHLFDRRCILLGVNSVR